MTSRNLRIFLTKLFSSWPNPSRSYILPFSSRHELIRIRTKRNRGESDMPKAKGPRTEAQIQSSARETLIQKRCSFFRAAVKIAPWNPYQIRTHTHERPLWGLSNISAYFIADRAFNLRNYPGPLKCHDFVSCLGKSISISTAEMHL